MSTGHFPGAQKDVDLRKSNRWRPDFSTLGKNFHACAQRKACDERRERRESRENMRRGRRRRRRRRRRRKGRRRTKRRRRRGRATDVSGDVESSGADVKPEASSSNPHHLPPGSSVTSKNISISAITDCTKYCPAFTLQQSLIFLIYPDRKRDSTGCFY